METFSFNKVRFAIGLVILLWLAWATAQDSRELKENRREVLFEKVLTVAVAASIVWLATVRLQMGRHGLTYRSITGSRPLLWRDVSKLFISWRQRYLARIIPWYRAYRIEVVDRKGNRVVFGNRFQGIPDLADRIAMMAAEHLTPARLADFKAGKSVDFGAVSLSQKGGVQIQGEPALKWADLVSFELTETELGLARRLGPPLIIPIRRVSMASVCEALLQEGLRAPTKAV